MMQAAAPLGLWLRPAMTACLATGASMSHWPVQARDALEQLLHNAHAREAEKEPAIE